MCNPRSPRKGPGIILAAPTPRGERLACDAPGVARVGTACGPPASSKQPRARTSHHALRRLPEGDTCGAARPRVLVLRGPVTHRLKASGCPPRRAGRRGGQEAAHVPFPRFAPTPTRQPPAPGPGPALRPRLQPVPQRRPPRDSPALRESGGAAGAAAAAALHGDLSSEPGARRGGPAGPA